MKNRICKLVCNEKPREETNWSTRTIAKHVGISHTAVSTVLKEYGLKPHRVITRNYSKDPDFEAKLQDVVGLYLKPPKNAIVLCVDKKTQIQALEREQPILPIIRNVPKRHSTDYIRHETTTLFAALDVLSGNVIGYCRGSHNSQEYIRFLKNLISYVPKEKFCILSLIIYLHIR